MKFIFSTLLFLAGFFSGPAKAQHEEEIRIVKELFRLRNEHKPDSVEYLFADTVLVYMKTLRNVPKQTITKLDRIFFKNHPKNKFEITSPIAITMKDGIAIANLVGKEYLDGTFFKYEKIEIRLDRNRKVNYFRAFNWRRASL